MPPVPQATAAMDTNVRPRATGVAKGKDTDHSTVVARTRAPANVCVRRPAAGRESRAGPATPRASGDRRRGGAMSHGRDASRRPRRRRRHSRGPGYRGAVDVRVALERVWRSDAAGMLGVLAARLGDLDRAEEALQEAAAEAMDHWARGLPENPAGWLVTTAWRRAVDR